MTKKHSKLTMKVPTRDYMVASQNWDRFVRSCSANAPYFSTFLGMHNYQYHYYGSVSSVVDCTEQAYQKIQMMASPHARTLLLAFKARTGYQAKVQ